MHLIPFQEQYYPLHFQTTDQITFTVPMEWLSFSPFLQSMSKLNTKEEMIAIEYSSHIFSQIEQFFTLYLHSPYQIKFPIIDQLHKYVSVSYMTYLRNMSNEILFETLHLACYLQLESLITLLTSYIASLVLHKSPEEIEKQFEL